MNLFERVKGILLNPRAEWSVIEREQGDVAYLFMNYVAILAAIPAVCGFIGTSLIGISLPGLGTVRVPIVTGLSGWREMRAPLAGSSPRGSVSSRG